MADSGAPVHLYLLFDSQCPLCCKFKDLIQAWDRDGAVRALPLDDPAIPERFPQLDLESARQNLTVCDRLGRVAQGVEAVQRVARLLPGIRRLQWVYRLPGVTPVLSRAYRTVSRHRKRLCLQCGQKWMPSLKSSRRRRRS